MERTRATENVMMPGSKSHTAHALSANASPKNSTTTKGAATASKPPKRIASSVTTRHTIAVMRSPSSPRVDATRGASTMPAAFARYHTTSARPVPTA